MTYNFSLRLSALPSPTLRSEEDDSYQHCPRGSNRSPHRTSPLERLSLSRERSPRIALKQPQREDRAIILRFD